MDTVVNGVEKLPFFFHVRFSAESFLKGGGVNLKVYKVSLEPIVVNGVMTPIYRRTEA